jgi:ribosomal protein L32
LLQAAKAKEKKKRTHFVTFATKAPEMKVEGECHSNDRATTTENLLMQKAP